jgi:hypothetical protein
MNPIEQLLRWEGLGFLGLLAALIAFRLLSGKINLKGLLASKNGGPEVSPERVQLLLATLAMCMSYLGKALHGTGNSLPDISPQMLYVFAGSSTLYASVKAWTTLKSR